MQLADIRDWIKTLDVAENYYIGKLDNKKDKSIGVYQLQNSSINNVAIGGVDNTKALAKSVSILIHWNDNAKDTEEIASSIYDTFLQVRDVELEEYKINYIKLLVPEAIDVGTDDKGIYERVIQTIFYYEKN